MVYAVAPRESFIQEMLENTKYEAAPTSMVIIPYQFIPLLYQYGPFFMLMKRISYSFRRRM